MSSPDIIDEAKNRYRIERELGQGATAVVYLAHDLAHDREVALKVLRQELVESVGAERFKREILTTAQLKHPHIVPVLGSGEMDGSLFFVLPYMDDGTLRDRLLRERQLAIPDVVAIGVAIASALEFAHERNLLHRDVKPENILFKNGQACLSDFGIARAITLAYGESSTTSTGLVRGTPAYMSPEQASGETRYDGRSDVYSLACVMYEALAGMQAFVGPTPQAVLAQRMLHEPRPIRVYRSSVPPALEAVIAKALAILPADRYESAAAFREALTQAVTQTARPQPVSKRRPRLMFATMIAVAVLGAAAWFARAGLVSAWRDAAPLDTTRVAILPPEGGDSALTNQVFGAIYDRTSAWRGIQPIDRFRIAELITPGKSLTDDGALAIAKRVAAGRYVRTRLVRDPDSWRVSSTLYDTRARERLFEAGARLTSSPAAMDSSLSRLVDSLLLRGVVVSSVGSRVLSAVQRYASAMHHITDEWDLRTADSLLSKAVEDDPDFATAWLWLAEARSAMFQPVARWESAVRRAAMGPQPTTRDSLLTTALQGLARGDFSHACDSFAAMRHAGDRDFIALYGLGQCRRMDSIVVRDSRSPSRWSFRSSEQRAVQAFAEAFAMAPLLHRGVQVDGYARLRGLLWTDAFARSGVSAPPDTMRFLALAEWRGDSLSFVPYPYAIQASAGAHYDAEARLAALRHQRLLFGRIARTWAAALPNSPGTIEALAIALEMNGERAAVDTLVKARSLATAQIDKIRLAAEEVFLRMEFMNTEDSTEARRVRALADSLVRVDNLVTPATAREIASVAALLGRCSNAAHFTAVASRTGGFSITPEVDSVAALVAMGCDGAIPPDALGRWFATSTPRTAADSTRAEYALLGRVASLAYPSDSARIARLAAASGDYLLRTEAAALAHDTGGVVAVLSRQLQRRRNSTQNISADARYYESQAWLSVGDTANARRWLLPLLSPTIWSPSIAFDAVTVGTALRGVLVLADLPLPDNERSQAVRWRRVIGVLWSAGDNKLRSLLPPSGRR